MKTTPNIPVIATFCVATLFIVVSITTVSLSRHVDNQLRISLIAPAVGGLIAVISAALLLFRTASGSKLHELIPLTIPLLAGVLIASYHWAIAIVLGTLGLSMIVREMVGTPMERRPGGNEANHQPDSET